MSLRLFAFFHLNLAFSSIEVEDRPKVLAQSYWPLVKVCRDHSLPFAIEATAWTLHQIKDIDPALFAALRDLVHDGPCEFVGSGYAQVIGPLVPSAVNAANQRLGMEAYQELLGIKPTIALINEQAFAAGLIPHYRDAGYDAIIMEWDNPSRVHPEWPFEARYAPVYARAVDGTAFPLIWNHSIAFQKVQRYAHGEIGLDNYLTYLHDRNEEDQSRALSLYGNDIEVFDFRPGRFMTEAPLHGDGEWARLERLFTEIKNTDDMSLIPLSSLLSELPAPSPENTFRLETAAQPTPVKKQMKYNLLRWAVSGRDDLHINTMCWQIYEATKISTFDDEDWRELIYLWSSDFRTHITESRWRSYQAQLEAMTSRIAHRMDASTAPLPAAPRTMAHALEIDENETTITVSNAHLLVRFNKAKGLVIDQFIDHRFGPTSIFGTLHHGFFDDIQYGADFFTGNLVYARPGERQITDLDPTAATVTHDGAVATLVMSVDLPIGRWQKTWEIDGVRGTVRLSCRLSRSDTFEKGSMRLGFVTLNPAFFDLTTLCYQTHNGGDLETFSLDETPVHHGQPLSLFITATHAVGLTEGVFRFLDKSHGVEIEIDKSKSALVGLVGHQPTSGSVFTRIEFTAQEIDDTFKDREANAQDFEACFTLRAIDAKDIET